MSDARPHDEASEVEALTDQREVQEGASPDAQRDAAETAVEDGGVDADREVDLDSDEPEESGAEAGADATDATGQDVDDAGTGTADTTDDPELDSPD